MTKKEFLEALAKQLEYVPDDAIAIIENNNVSFLIKAKKTESRDMIFIPGTPWDIFNAIRDNTLTSK